MQMRDNTVTKKSSGSRSARVFFFRWHPYINRHKSLQVHTPAKNFLAGRDIVHPAPAPAGKTSLPFEALPARHLFLHEPGQPDAVAAPLYAAVFAFPQMVDRDDMPAGRAFYIFCRSLRIIG
jgi:hypothetical protein